MDIRWVKIKAWHAVLADYTDGYVTTRCGRHIMFREPGGIISDLPAEKSCESCLRIVARIQDAAAIPRSFADAIEANLRAERPF